MKKRLPELSCTIPLLAPNLDNLTAGNKLAADRVRILLHNIYVSWVYEDCRDKKDDFHKDGWTALDSRRLQSLLTARYCETVEFCERHRLIEVKRTETGNKSYITCHRATPYRIHPSRLPKNGNRFRMEKIISYKAVSAVLRDKSKQKAIMAGRAGAMAYPHLDTMTEEFYFDLAPMDTFIRKVLAGKEKPVRKNIQGMVDYLYLAPTVNEGLYSTSTDTFGRRFHSPFTQTPRELRQFIRMRNHEESLCMVDIRNSQPFFLALALAFPDKAAELLPELSPLVNATNSIRYGDRRLFLRHAAEGTLYDHWKESRGLCNREAGKNEIIKAILFSNPKYNRKKYADSRNTFAFRFPDTWAALNAIKNVDVFFERKALHKNASLLCQQLESNFLLDRVAGELVKKADMGPFLTIHDSFLVRAKDEQTVKEVISQCFQSFNLPAPTTKTTYYGQ